MALGLRQPLDTAMWAVIEHPHGQRKVGQPGCHLNTPPPPPPLQAHGGMGVGSGLVRGSLRMSQKVKTGLGGRGRAC